MPANKKEATRTRTAAVARIGGQDEEDEDNESPPYSGILARSDAAYKAFIQRQQDKMAALEAEEEKNNDDNLRVTGPCAKTPEPALQRDFECLRCVLSVLHGDTSGWCVPATGRSKKCQRCAVGKNPCLTIREGTELRRLAGEFLAAKRGNVARKRLSRATSALRSRIAFEGTLIAGDPQISTQKCYEGAAREPSSQRPLSPPGGIAPNQPVDAASLSDDASSTAVTVANEDQAAKLRAAIDSLVGASLPAEQMPAYHLLMELYIAHLGDDKR
ncbi:hypothetical protein CSUB01_06166 [Colletotrichum sublineola]|uniref:Uncharacterized protein n=1 Tax=Colletotrichum sublineola TaxID=1173701 RepID=A0A066XEE1_COLSU|nr:hypothetical protein CSUB01_06166 [Colletotrichum sublineola]